MPGRGGCWTAITLQRHPTCLGTKSTGRIAKKSLMKQVCGWNELIDREEFMGTIRLTCLSAIIVALIAAVPSRAEVDRNLPHEKVTLVPLPLPFVRAHKQATKAGPRTVEFFSC